MYNCIYKASIRGMQVEKLAIGSPLLTVLYEKIAKEDYQKWNRMIRN